MAIIVPHGQRRLWWSVECRRPETELAGFPIRAKRQGGAWTTRSDDMGKSNSPVYPDPSPSTPQSSTSLRATKWPLVTVSMAVCPSHLHRSLVHFHWTRCISIASPLAQNSATCSANNRLVYRSLPLLSLLARAARLLRGQCWRGRSRKKEVSGRAG